MRLSFTVKILNFTKIPFMVTHYLFDLDISFYLLKTHYLIAKWFFIWRYDTRHNDIHHNSKVNATLGITTINIMAVLLFWAYSDCRLFWVSQMCPLCKVSWGHMSLRWMSWRLTYSYKGELLAFPKNIRLGSK